MHLTLQSGHFGLHCGHACAVFAPAPVHCDGLEVLGLGEEALVSQVAQHQPLWVGAQGHEGDDFYLVEINRQRTFARNAHGLHFTLGIHGLDGVGERGARLRQVR